MSLESTTKSEDSNLSKIFREYSSINNYTNSKFINEIKELPQAEWVVMEKVHGANFSFITDGQNVRIASRSIVLSIPNFFFTSTAIAEKYNSDVLEIYRRIQTGRIGMDSLLDPTDKLYIQIFGEIFGGNYPGCTRKYKPVQKGVNYAPEHDFLVFDIRVDIKSKSEISFYLSQTEIDHYLDGLSNLRGLPVLFRSNNFDEILNLNPKFITTIPKLYGLKDLTDNYAEGYVCKTNDRHDANKTRPIIKIKYEYFSEVTKNVTDSENVTDPKNYFDRILPYCTQNRFNNIISKHGASKVISSLIGHFVTDMLDDFQKELDREELEQFKEDSRSIKKTIFEHIKRNQLCQKWLDEYHLDSI
jgi:Rnl2 family RNA ligase